MPDRKSSSTYAFPFPEMFGSTWARANMNTWSRMASLAVASQQVIWLRLSKLAVEGATAANQREMQRMVSEKMDAVSESGQSLTKLATSLLSAAPQAFTDPKAAKRMATRSAIGADRALRPFSRRVHANVERLSH